MVLHPFLKKAVDAVFVITLPLGRTYVIYISISCFIDYIKLYCHCLGLSFLLSKEQCFSVNSCSHVVKAGLYLNFCET